MWDQSSQNLNWASPPQQTSTNESDFKSDLFPSMIISNLTSPTLNLSTYIEDHLGPQRALALNWLIPMTAVYIIILVFGLVGNLITILVIFRFRYMQTITNLYLCNLAITDLISLLLSLPLELYTLWHQYPWQLGETMCRMKTLILEGTANASVLTLVAFTLERFLAICASSSSNIPPVGQSMFNPNSLSHVKRIAIRNIALIWTISISGAMPLVMLTRINYLKFDNQVLEESAWCGLPFSEPDKKWEMVILASTVIFFLIPLLLISALYYKIAKKLKAATRLNSFSADQHTCTSAGSSVYLHHQIYNHNTTLTQNSAVLDLPSIVPEPNNYGASRKLMQSRKIVIRMLVVIVIVFTFCWSPFHAQRLLFLYVTLYSSWNWVLRQINSVLFLSAGCLYYLNSSLNPLIYSLLSTRFRAAFVLYVNSLCGKYCSSNSTNGCNKSHTGTNNNNNNHSGNPSNASNSQACRTKNYPMWPPQAATHSPKPHQTPMISPTSNVSLNSVYTNSNHNNNNQKFYHSPLISLAKKGDNNRLKHYRSQNSCNSGICQNHTNSLKNHSPLNECSCCSLNSPNSQNGNVSLNCDNVRSYRSSPKLKKMSLFSNMNDSHRLQSPMEDTLTRSQTHLYRNFCDANKLSSSNSQHCVSQNGSKNIFR